MVRRAPADDPAPDFDEPAAVVLGERAPIALDERAAVAAAQRDPACFVTLYEANFERVYAYVARRVADRDEARDLTAEVFHRALRHVGRFEWRGVPFAGWLLRIAANAIADRAERTTRERTIAVATAADDVSLPADAVDFETRARLFRLVDALPADQRRVIVLRFAEQRSIAEIAATLGRSEGAVKQLQFRALAFLRARLGGSRD